jgi:protein disulfide-isomerase
VHDISATEFDIYEKKDEVIFLYFYDQATTSEDFEALDRTSLSLIGHAPLLRTDSEILVNRFRITSFPKLIVLRDGKTSYYNALSPRDMRDHRRLLAWMKSVWLPMVPELSAANSHEVMQGRTVVLGILDRTLKDFEQTKQKLKTAALEWLDVRASEDKAEKEELREQKESKIEQAEEKGDKRAIEKAKGIQVVVKPKKEVGFAWVDGVFWSRWCRGTYGVDVRETGPRFIINEQDVPSHPIIILIAGKTILGRQSPRKTYPCNDGKYH